LMKFASIAHDDIFGAVVAFRLPAWLLGRCLLLQNYLLKSICQYLDHFQGENAARLDGVFSEDIYLSLRRGLAVGAECRRTPRETHRVNHPVQTVHPGL